jgi:hypothetical protein
VDVVRRPKRCGRGSEHRGRRGSAPPAVSVWRNPLRDKNATRGRHHCAPCPNDPRFDLTGKVAVIHRRYRVYGRRSRSSSGAPARLSSSHRKVRRGLTATVTALAAEQITARGFRGERWRGSMRREAHRVRGGQSSAGWMCS